MEKILNNQVIESFENLQGGKVKCQSTFILGNKQLYQLFYN